MSRTQALTFETEAAPSRMGGATGSAERAAPRPSLLDRLIEERRRGDCTDARRPSRPTAPAAPAEPAAITPPAVGEPRPAEPRPEVPSAAPVAIDASPVMEAVAPPAEAAAPLAASPVPAPPLAAGERSLADLVSSTWEALATAETASCFVCGGDLLPRFGAGARSVGGRCSDCGSELS